MCTCVIEKALCKQTQMNLNTRFWDQWYQPLGVTKSDQITDHHYIEFVLSKLPFTVLWFLVLLKSFTPKYIAVIYACISYLLPYFFQSLLRFKDHHHKPTITLLKSSIGFLYLYKSKLHNLQNCSW